MLKFTPEHQLLFAPSQGHYLQTTLTMSNPTPRPAPFKVKASKPSLFEVTPSVGLILPKQSVRVQIVSRYPNTPQLVHDISYQNKFMVEYALLERVPPSIQEGLQLITQDNRQQKRLFAAVENAKDTPSPENYSGISNKYSYRTALNERNDSGQHYMSMNRRQSYQKMSEDQKFQHLSNQIDRLEIQKSHLLTSTKPKSHHNLLRFAIILVVCILTGYFAGKSLNRARLHSGKKQKEYRWFGLEKYWAKQEEVANKQWWAFWK